MGELLTLFSNEHSKFVLDLSLFNMDSMLAPNIRRKVMTVTPGNANILFDLIHSKSVPEREGMCF